MLTTCTITERDELAWDDGKSRRIYFLAGRGVSCKSLLLMDVAPRLRKIDAICLGTEGKHFFVGIVKEFGSVAEALEQLHKNNAIVLPPHRSTQPIPLEAVEIFQKYGADIGVAPGDTTRIVSEKVMSTRGYLPFKLSRWSFE